MPSTGITNSFPKFDELTLLGVRIVSFRFCPVRALSLWYVNTSAAGAGGGAAVVTVRVVLPLVAPETALMVVVPALTAVANPVELIVAAAAFDEDQVAVFVRSWVVLSLNAPVAVNC